MKTYARLDGDVVVEIIATSRDIATMFHPALRWIDVTGMTVTVGDVQAGSGFHPPAALAEPAMPTLAGLQAEVARLSALIAAYTKTD